MEKGNYIHIPLLTACLVALSGCAASTVSPIVKSERQTSVVDNNDSHDSVILSRLIAMNPGDKDSADGVSFTVGETYTAASGRRCKPVTISGDSTPVEIDGRVACEHGKRWFFSENIFLSDSRK